MEDAQGVLDEFGEGRNTRVLIVDDQQEIHDDFREMLTVGAAVSSDKLAAAFVPERRPFLPAFELLHATDGEQGCAAISMGQQRGRPVACAYVDIRMPPGIDGVETIRRMRQVDRDVEIVIMTAYTDKSLSEIVGDMELRHKLLYIRKPFAREEIQQSTLSLVVKWNVERALVAGRRQLACSHRRLEAVLDATGDALAMYDGAGRLVFANRRYREVLNVQAEVIEELPREEASSRFVEWSRDPRGWEVEDGRFGGPGSVVEPVAANAGGKPSRGRRSLFYRSEHPVRDADDTFIGDLVVYRDVSREIEIEWMKREMQRLRSEVETIYSFDGIIGASAEMRELCASMKRAVDSDVPVLVVGESGTGKELVAKALHFNGPRRRQPFLAVNCAAVPEDRIESELFGHERGAFAGASARKAGCLEQAAGGTLLLDEVGDLPSALQAKLLCVLQNGEIRRPGGTASVHVDVRIIAATHRDLEAAVSAGTFRSDLFYRLVGFPLAVPPLRDRAGDVVRLADYFLARHALRLGRAVRGISDAAYRRLEEHDWPGNVRELENAICRAIALETTDLLRADHLPGGRGSGEYAAAVPDGLVMPLADVEAQAIARALEVFDHNLTHAAEALGIDRATLQRKLKKQDGA